MSEGALTYTQTDLIEDIELMGGAHALDPVWRDPENLPTLEELQEPASWLARVA